MKFKCTRCDKKGLRCFVEAETLSCGSCIKARVECELLVPEEEWDKAQELRRLKELEVARAEESLAVASAALARSKRELLEAKGHERRLALRDRDAIALQDELDAQDSVDAASSTDPTVNDLTPTDLGWSQAEFDSLMLVDFATSSFTCESLVDPALGEPLLPVSSA